MNGKELLEALSHVDEKYVQEAELAAPTAGNTVLRRVVAAAACVCLLLAGVKVWPIFQSANDSMEQENASQPILSDTDGKEMVPESAAAQDPQSYTFGCQYIRTDQILYVDIRTQPVVIRTAEELDAYLEQFENIFQLEELKKACAGYDETFFQNRDLILVLQEEGSGSVRHEIQGLRALDGGAWELTGRRIVPEVGTCDMAQWHIVVEVQKNVIAKDETIILSWYE